MNENIITIIIVITLNPSEAHKHFLVLNDGMKGDKKNNTYKLF